MQSALLSYLQAEDDAAVSEVDFENVIVEDDENDAEETETIVGLGRFEGTAAAERGRRRVCSRRERSPPTKRSSARGQSSRNSPRRGNEPRR